MVHYSALFSILIASASASAAPASPSTALVRCEKEILDREFSPDSFDKLFEKTLVRTTQDKNLLPDDAALELAVQELYREGLIESDSELVVFVAATKMQPLFKSGIVYRAIVEEFIHLGYTSRSQMKTLAKRFSLISEHQKREAIENIIENIKFTLAHAKITDAYYDAEFVHAWRGLEFTGYIEAKLVLIDSFLRADRDFTSGILKARRAFFGLTGKLRKNAPQQRRAQKLLAAGNDVEKLPFKDRFKNASYSERESFILSQLAKLRREDVEFLQALPSQLSAHILNLLSEKLTWFNAVDAKKAELAIAEQEYKQANEAYSPANQTVFNAQNKETSARVEKLRKETSWLGYRENQPFLFEKYRQAVRLWGFQNYYKLAHLEIDSSLSISLVKGNLDGRMGPLGPVDLHNQPPLAKLQHFAIIMSDVSVRCTDEVFTEAAVYLTSQWRMLEDPRIILDLYSFLRDLTILRKLPATYAERIRKALQIESKHLQDALKTDVLNLAVAGWNRSTPIEKDHIDSDLKALFAEITPRKEELEAEYDRKFKSLKLEIHERNEARSRRFDEASNKKDRLKQELKALLETLS